MGNEASLVRDYKLEKEIPTQASKGWRLYQSRRRDGSRVSVFVYEPQKTSIQYIENAAKYLKVLRHPSVLKFDGLEKTSDGIWLATEQVTPLENKLEGMCSAEIVAGIYSLLEALIFLHDRGGFCHNNICMSSVFVSEDGMWKLGGVEYVCRFDQASPAYLAKCKNFRDKDTLAPEENVSYRAELGKVDPEHPGWARDVYSFGILVQMLLDYVTDLGNLTKSFKVRVQGQCLDPDPNRRPKLNTLLHDPLFTNDFLQIINFLKNVTLKSETEKRNFFWNIVRTLYAIPQDVLATRLVRPLLSRFVLLDSTACTRLLPHLLTSYKGDKRPDYVEDAINPLLSERLFCRHVIPELFKIFYVRDVHVRSALLCHFSRYVHQFDKDALKRHILPQIFLGVQDLNDKLVQLSLLAIAELVPVLGGDTVVGPHRFKLFVEAAPKQVCVNHIGNGQCLETNGLVRSEKSSPVHILESTHDPMYKTVYKKNKIEQYHRRHERNQRPSTVKAVVPTEGTDQNGVHNRDGVAANLQPGWSESSSIHDEEESGGFIDEVEKSIDVQEEIGGELVLLESSLDSSVQDNSQLQCVKERSADKPMKCTSGSRGALKLESSKVRTSPPPSMKLDSSPPRILQKEFDPEKHSSDYPCHDSTTGEEVLASPEEVDQWNSTDWQDIDGMDDAACSENDDTLHSMRNVQSEKPVEGGSPQSSNTSTTKKSATLISENRTSQCRTVDLDINSLDIKTLPIKISKEPEIDFFADMQPSIRVARENLWGVLNDNKTGSPQQHYPEADDAKDGSHKAISFAAVSLPENEVGEGWAEEDVDWADDD